MDLKDTVILLNRPEKHFLGSFYFLNVKAGIDAALDGTPYQVLLVQQDSDFAKSLTSGQQNMTGIISIAPHINHESITLMEQAKTPAVLVNCRSNGLSWVDLDNVTGAKAMAEHLLKLGHEKILFISGFPESQNSIDRMRGFQLALDKYKVRFNPKQVVTCDFSITLAYEKMKEYLQQNGVNFTAVFATNDLMAVGAIRALVDEHVRIPEDVAVAGFDDFDFSSTFYIPLTTYRQPFRNIGFLATKMLLRQIENGFDGGQKAELIGDVVIRESCGSKIARQ
jgi:LacI family repressor for deo operon, udp, cdd, tsx, nupC, and nupG